MELRVVRITPPDDGVVTIIYDDGARQHMTRWELAAIETWLKQPKEPTPEERATAVVDWLVTHCVISHVSGIEHVEAQNHISVAIRAAIDADRKVSPLRSRACPDAR